MVKGVDSEVGPPSTASCVTLGTMVLSIKWALRE